MLFPLRGLTRTAALVAGVVLVVGMPFAQGSSVAAGQDAAAQVGAGAAVYQSACANCHGVAGEGGEGPALSDVRALRPFRTAGRLSAFLRLSMPYDAPGSLSTQEYYDVTAYLLDWHGLNPDGHVVGPDTADELTFP